MSKAIIQALIGLAFWIAYLGTVWTGVSVGIPRVPLTYALIPFSIVGYYLAVRCWLFGNRASIVTFMRFLALTLAAWAVFGVITEGLVAAGIDHRLANLVAAAGNGMVNLTIQRRYALEGMRQ